MGSCGIDLLIFDYESHIRKYGIVDQLPQIFYEVAWWDRYRFKAEFVKVVKHDAPIVSTKDVKRIIVHLCNKRRATTWWVFSAYREPSVTAETEFIKIVQPFLAIVASK